VAESKPRVLFLLPDIGVGGAERGVQMITQYAEEGGFIPLVATLRAPRRPVNETVIGSLTESGVPLMSLDVAGRCDRSPYRFVQAATRLRAICRMHSVHVVDSCLAEADLVARAALFRSDVKHVVHLVNTPYESVVRNRAGGRGRWRHRAMQMLDSVSSPLTDAFVALTEVVATSARQRLGVRADRLAVIPRGVDANRFRPCFSRERDGGRLRLLSVGRLVPQKDHRTAVDAVALLVRRGVDVIYTIHGEGPLEERIRDLIRERGLQSVVKLVPPTQEVPSVLCRNDVFLMPSLWEGQSNAIIEAMASATPVLASDLPVFREVVGDGGRYFRAGDPVALADAIEEFAQADDQWPTIGQDLHRRAVQKYSPEAQSRDLGALYRSLLR
jgi:L-malate glycosyltransferase